MSEQPEQGDRELTADDIAVIRERFHGWEMATAKDLAAIFGVSVQRISAIVHSNRPDFGEAA